MYKEKPYLISNEAIVCICQWIPWTSLAPVSLPRVLMRGVTGEHHQWVCFLISLCWFLFSVGWGLLFFNCVVKTVSHSCVSLHVSCIADPLLPSSPISHWLCYHPAALLLINFISLVVLPLCTLGFFQWFFCLSFSSLVLLLDVLSFALIWYLVPLLLQ